MPSGGSMLRISVVTIAVLLVAGPAALAQLPPQPPPVKNSITQGSDQERAACHPDVMRYCKQLVRDDGQDDVFAILGCLQSNRARSAIPVSKCWPVTASEGRPPRHEAELSDDLFARLEQLSRVIPRARHARPNGPRTAPRSATAPCRFRRRPTAPSPRTLPHTCGDLLSP